MERLVELLEKHEDIPEAAAARDAIGDGNIGYALEMLDRVLAHSREVDDAMLVYRLPKGTKGEA